MHFYRTMKPIKALTFDLDDTLYDNSPFMAWAEKAVIESLRQQTNLPHIQLDDFSKVKKAVLLAEPDIYHDVLIWRAAAIKSFLTLQGIKDKIRQQKITDIVMADFIRERNKINVPQSTLATLTNLAKMYPLAVITNGNAEIDKIGLSPYFKFALRAGPDGLAKPFVDMFKIAAERLAVPMENILHVGDYLYADVQGAINSGMQSCWLNITGGDIYQNNDATVLPHVEINQLSELNNLL